MKIVCREGVGGGVEEEKREKKGKGKEEEIRI